MALPVTFGNETVATGGQLDTNFQAVGILGILPCLIAGTNALVLTQQANTPTITAYANYMKFSGIISATNTGPMTAVVGSLPVLPVYKDTVSGPVVLSGGELVIHNAVTLTYDSALDAGSGGFHVSASSSGGGSGTVTSVGSGTGLTGGPITGAGTLSITRGLAGQGYFTTASGLGWGPIVSATTTATGTNQGTAASIGLCTIVVITVAGSGTGIILPAASGLTEIIVLNRGGSNLSVYPNSSAQIEGLGVNAADTVAATSGNARYVSTTMAGTNATQWYRTVAS